MWRRDAADFRARANTKGARTSSTHAPHNAPALMLVNLFTHPEAKDNNKLFRMNF